MADREQLIRDLASSYGMTDIHKSKYNGSRFDVATGTFYCDGVMIPRHTMEKAQNHFKEQMDYLKGRSNQSSELMEMYLFNTIAYNAICMLKNTLTEGK